MRRTGIIGSVLLAAVVGLAGCSGEGSGSHVTTVRSSQTPTAIATSASTTAPSPVPTVPADVPTTGKNLRSPDEKPPVMPIAATQHTAAGAVAFAEFFVKTIDWGYATSDPAYMNHYYEQSCIQCRNYRTGLLTAKRAATYYRGSRTLIQSSALGTGAVSPQDRISVTLRIDVTAWEVVDTSGKTFAAGKAQKNLKQQIQLRWITNGWSVVGLDLST